MVTSGKGVIGRIWIPALNSSLGRTSYVADNKSKQKVRSHVQYENLQIFAR